MVRPLQLITLLFLLSSTLVYSQDWQWAKSSGSALMDNGAAIVTDAVGNSYVTGSFQGTVAFGNTILTSSGDADIFVIKYDFDGNVLWANAAGGSGFDNGLGIAVDNNGNSYVTGKFTGTATFGTTTLTNSVASENIFVTKYDTDGNLIWATKAGGTNPFGGTKGVGIAVDADGKCYVTGTFQGTGYFGTTTLTSSGGMDIFVAKYDANGNVIWAKSAGGTGSDYADAIAVDDEGNAYVTGDFRLTATFGSFSLTYNGGFGDIFVAKYDTNGEVLWARKASGSGTNSGRGIDLDSKGDCYLTGYFQETLYFDDITLISNGGDDIFLAKYDKSGNAVWARRAGGTGNDLGWDLKVDQSGNSYLTGRFDGNATFGEFSLSSSGVNDIFVAKYDPDGNAAWARKAGGTGADNGLGIGIDVNGNSYITGWFELTAAFSGTSFTSNGQSDVFIAKVSALLPYITSQPLSKTITGGENTSFTVSANGTEYTYQWQVSKDGGETFLNISNGLSYSGANTATLSIVQAPVSLNNSQFRVQVSNGSVIVSDAAILTVRPPAFNNARVWQNVGGAGFSDGQTEYTSLAIDANGNQYVAYLDFYNGRKATVKKYDGTEWLNVGPAGFSEGDALDIKITLSKDGTPYVIYRDGANDYKATVKKYDGGNWVNVGSAGFSNGDTYDTCIKLSSDDTPYVAFKDRGNDLKATVMKYNGFTWETVGAPGISQGEVYYISLAFDGNDVPYVVYNDWGAERKTFVKRYVGNDWVDVVSEGFKADNMNWPSIAIDGAGTPYVSYMDWEHDYKATVKKYDGKSWVNVGAVGFSKGRANYTNIVLDASGTPFVSYMYWGGDNKATVKRFDGDSWVDVGASGFSAGYAKYPSLALDGSGTPYVAYSDGTKGYRATVMKFAPNAVPTAISLSSNNIPENEAPYFIVGSLSTTDADVSDNHTYALVTGEGSTDNSSFLISGANLVFRYSADFETKSTYSIRVRTSDGKSNGVFVKALTIQVVDINEAPTLISISSADIDENNEQGATIGTLTTTDQDAGDTHTYTLVSGEGDTDNASFTVDGNVLKAAQIFDFETKSSYSIRLQTRDRGGLTHEVLQIITINDVDETITSIATGENNKLVVYPNPANNSLLISSDNKIDQITLVNSQGRTVLTEHVRSMHVQLNLESVSSGVYTVLLSSGDKIFSRRIVVTK